jgi:hypothetical protein
LAAKLLSRDEARLDRLSSVRDVAQIGAAIGRAFSYELPAAVAPGGSNELTEALTQLTSAEIIFARGQPPEATYIFKHALLQDAAYSSLLRTRRQQLHARIAEVLEQKFWDISERRPEILAHHYGAAGLDDQAKRHWMRATQLALAQSNYAEAIAHSAHALEMVRKAPPSSDRSREGITAPQRPSDGVQRGQGTGVGGCRPPCRGGGDDLRTAWGRSVAHFRARWNDWRYRAQSGDLGGASERADILVEMASRSGATDLRLQAHHARWTTAFVRGQVAVTREAVECGLALYDFEQHKDHWAVYGGHDPGVCARATGACTLWQAGLSERGAAVAEDAIRVAHNLGHPYSQSVALWYAGFFAMMVGDAASARAHAERLAEHAAEGRWALVAAMSKIIAAWAVTQTGEIGSGAQQMEAEFRNFLHTKQRAYLTFLGTRKR